MHAEIITSNIAVSGSGGSFTRLVCLLKNIRHISIIRSSVGSSDRRLTDDLPFFDDDSSERRSVTFGETLSAELNRPRDKCFFFLLTWLVGRHVFHGSWLLRMQYNGGT